MLVQCYGDPTLNYTHHTTVFRSPSLVACLLRRHSVLLSATERSDIEFGAAVRCGLCELRSVKVTYRYNYRRVTLPEGKEANKGRGRHRIRNALLPLKVQIILARTPCLCSSACRPVRILWYCTFDVFEGELPLEFCFEGR